MELFARYSLIRNFLGGAILLICILMMNYSRAFSMATDSVKVENNGKVKIKKLKENATMKYPILSPLLTQQLSKIEPSFDDLGAKLYPFSVELFNGDIIENVILMEKDQYYYYWGVWPHDDREKKEVYLKDVKQIIASKNRIPIPFSQKIYGFGESGMGFTVFYFIFRDGSKVLSVCGGICDFFIFPDGYLIEDIIDVETFKRDGTDKTSPKIETADYYFCLYQLP